MNNKQTNIDIFKMRVELLKKQIVLCTKSITKGIKDAKHAKSENDKKAILDQLTTTRRSLDNYRQVLDDLTYAFVKSRPVESKKIVSKFGYKTPEGFLRDREKDIQPSLNEMMELITTGYNFINTVYQTKYGEDGKKHIIRNMGIVTGVNKKVSKGPSFRVGSNPAISYDDERQVQSAVVSASRHR